LGRKVRVPIRQIDRVPHRVVEAGAGCPGITEVLADQGTDRIERRTRGGIETEGVFLEVAHAVAIQVGSGIRQISTGVFRRGPRGVRIGRRRGADGNRASSLEPGCGAVIGPVRDHHAIHG